MIIRSIRLKNIKSYGEGATGEGITVEFARGINRIAGRNGHGKSTLIESLGYALFLTPPFFEENVRVTTYLLRAGEKHGEIDVTFEYDGEVYRVERGLGLRSPRRSKVVQLGDGSIAAEGEDEVSAFLCRLFGCPGADRLSELFAKLVGVKQGRLAWPFDSKPTEARKHFEPLLDVEIFRQCFEQLRPVIGEFNQAAQVETTRLAAVSERVRDRLDAPDRVKARGLEVEVLTESLASAKGALVKAEEEKLRWEALEKSWVSSRNAHEKARGEAELARTHRKHAEDRLAESVQAAEIAAQSEAAHAVYVAAERALSLLQEQQRERSRIEKHRSDANARRIAFDEKAASAEALAEDRDKRRSQCEQRLAELGRDSLNLRNALTESKPPFDIETKRIAQMRADEETVRYWVGNFAEKTKRLSELGTIIERTKQTLEKWDAALFEKARENEQSTWRSLQEATLQLSAATELSRSLQRQLAEISEGVCPFLKERCSQFDPAKVASDLRAREVKLSELNRQLVALDNAHKLAKEKADELAKAEAKMTHQRADLEGRIGQLRHEGSALVPKSILECCERLGLLKIAPPNEVNGDIPGWLAEVHSLSAAATESFKELSPTLHGRFAAFEEARTRRVGEEHHLATLDKDCAALRNDVLILSEEIAAKRKEADRLRIESASEVRAIQEMEKSLAAYAKLDEQIGEEQRRKLVHTADHQRHIAAKPIADELAGRQRKLAELAALETTAVQQVARIALELQTAAAAFNPEALVNARRIQHACATNAGIAGEKLANAKRELERDTQRLQEFEKATEEKRALELEISRIQASIEVTDKARDILKNAAPYVAQHLCQRIAARAQQIFNHINHEPSKLDWSSEQYSLRIDPGDRRFAMLSGGEQTKLALAMTLALIQEFSGLKFCVFDEPTYGVDGDSRLKLADAILAAQEAAGFDQLLLVSHDDAFDGRIEHTVRLSKSGMGTQPVAE